jgi:hypothetical protein
MCPVNAHAILAMIDNGELRLSANRVTRRLCDHVRYSDPSDLELITAFDSGDAMDQARWLMPLWERIVALPMNKQGALRLLWGLLIADEPLERYDAEFLIHWAREQGVQEEEILRAFDPT